MITLESPVNDMATDKRLFIPPESSLDLLCKLSCSPTYVVILLISPLINFCG